MGGHVPKWIDSQYFLFEKMGGYAPKYIAKIYFQKAMLKGWVALLRKTCAISLILTPFSIKMLAFWVVMFRNGGRFSGWVCSEFTNGTSYHSISEIIYHRYRNQLTTILTTNLTDNELASRYGPRIMDRLEESFEFIAYTNPGLDI